MDLNPTHFPFPSHLSSNLTTLSILQDKQDIKISKKKKEKLNLLVEAVVLHNELITLYSIYWQL